MKDPAGRARLLAEYFPGINPRVVLKAVSLFDDEGAVAEVKNKRNRWSVLNPRTPSRRVTVRRTGDQFRCDSDKHDYSQDKPCSHILAVLIYLGYYALPNEAGAVPKKGDHDRPAALEARAWRLVPTRLPALLAQLLGDGLPVVAPKLEPTGGRPRTPIYPQVYQAVMRVAFRQSHQCAQGWMLAADHLQHNPDGPVGAATLSRFLSDPTNIPLLEKLLALTTWPARPYESLVHPDGTGISEQHFSDYFEERPKNRQPPKKDQQVRDDEPPEAPPPRRHHRWTYAEILWTYRYTMVAAIHTNPGPFGEAQWMIPLVERARLMLNPKEAGGDKAYNAYYIFDYLARQEIEPQVKFKVNANPTRSHGKKKAYKRTFEASKLDPEGYAAKANRRNNAETGNHAFKAILGSEVYSRGKRNRDGSLDFTSRRNEVLCMCIAYNLTRLVFLELMQDIEADFRGGVKVLASRSWESLESLHHRFYKRGVPLPSATQSPA